VAAPAPVSCSRSAASCSSRPVKDRTVRGIVHVRLVGTAGAGAAHPCGQFVDEAGRSAGGVGTAGALAGVQHLAGVGAGCQ